MLDLLPHWLLPCFLIWCTQRNENRSTNDLIFGILAGLVMNGEMKERTDRNSAKQTSPKLGEQKKPPESPLAS